MNQKLFSSAIHTFRLYTHGYDLFAPAETVLYHLYSRAHRPVFQTDRSSGAGAAAELVAAQKAQSAQTVRRMLQLQDPRAGLRGAGGDVDAGNGVKGPVSKENTVLATGADRLCGLNLKKYGLGECSVAPFIAS
jgi:hypothetical protein